MVYCKKESRKKPESVTMAAELGFSPGCTVFFSQFLVMLLSEVAENGPQDDGRKQNDRGVAPVCGGTCPAWGARTVADEENRGGWQGEEECGVEMPGGGNVAVRQGMEGAERPAAGTVVAGEQLRRAARIEARLHRVEAVEHDNCGHRQNYGGRNQCFFCGGCHGQRKAPKNIGLIIITKKLAKRPNTMASMVHSCARSDAFCAPYMSPLAHRLLTFEA